MVSGVFDLNEYDYNRPNAVLYSMQSHPYTFEHGNMAVYDYPGGYGNRELGDRLTEFRRDAERNQTERWFAAGYAPSLLPGHMIERKAQPKGNAQDGDYCILRCGHWYGDQTY